jgi:hypothetical protein
MGQIYLRHTPILSLEGGAMANTEIIEKNL